VIDLENAQAQAPGHLEIFRFRRDFPSLLTVAGLSVSQAGYNTVCDLLRAGCRSLLVPFAAGGETEQTTRANRLEALGLASVLPEEALNGATLTEAIKKAERLPKAVANSLDLQGATKTAELIGAGYRRFKSTD
jgi:predicted glycosyltransferase